MVYRGAKPREPKNPKKRKSSSPKDKLRRHKNKKRIWKRAVAKLKEMRQKQNDYLFEGVIAL